MSEFRSLLTVDRTTTVDLLACMGEVDGRKLYLAEGYPSMYVFCVHELHMSEDVALKRIHVARAARKFPAILALIADGRLHLTGAGLLVPYLTPGNADELLQSGIHRTKAEIGTLLADRFPRPDVPTSMRAVASEELVPEPVGLVPDEHTPAHVRDEWVLQHAPAHVQESVGTLVPQHAPAHAGRQTIAPLSAGRFEVRFTLGQAGHDKLAYAQSLLGHALPSGDIAAVVERGLDRLIEHLERRVFAATARSRPRKHSAKACRVRHIPAEVRREVWRRDGGRCTFVGDSGRRCSSCTRLEFDHADPVARGGESTSANLRLRCRAHNQYAAERMFGAGFMDRKRQEARARSTHAQMAATAEIQHAPAHVESRAGAEIEHAPAHVEARTVEKIEHAPAHVENRDEVIPWLRALGFRATEARQGAAMCEGLPDATLEERVRFALAGLGRDRFRRATRVACPAG